MRRAPVRLLSGLMILAAAACAESDILLPDGTPSTLDVRVYVDRDGNGTFDAGSDVPIGGAEVTAMLGEAEAGSATSDDTGLAALVDLIPGSYQLSLTATPPAGAVLATASAPLVVAPFQGDSLNAEFRFAFQPGTLAGALYRDDDGDGEYTPGTDTPLPGASLALVEVSPGPAAPAITGSSSMAPADTVAETTTDADGAFIFESVRPGDYTIEIEPIEGLTFPNGTSIPVTAGSEVAVVVDVEFEGDLLITIADARARPDGALVTIEGVITWQEQWRRSLAAFVQDGTAGINLFDFDCDFDDAAANCPEVVPGDSVRVTGVRGGFSGELQISGITELTILGTPGTPTPRAVTAAQINAGEYQGELVTIDGTVTDLLVLSFDNQVVTLDDAAGDAYTVYVDSRTGVGSTTWVVGSEYVLTGVLGNNDSNTPSARLEVRSPSDVLSGSGATPIATARTQVGDTVIVQGVVTWQAQWDSRVYFLQDETGGISTFDAAVQPTLNRGDIVRVQAEISTFRSETNLSPVLTAAVVGQTIVPTPRAVTGAEINAGQYQGELVSIEATVDSLTDIDGFDNHRVWLTDGASTVFTVYVDSRNGMASTDWTADAVVTVQGVLGTDDRNTLPYRVEPRDINDLITGPAPTTLADARAATAGTTVTVEGVVTWQQQWDSRVYYFQDATGGISTFDSNVQPTLQRGDRIRITGDVGAFRSEVQLSPVTAVTVLGQEAVPAPRVVTGAEINAGSFQGELVTISAMVDSVLVLSFDNQRVFLTDDDGTVFNVYVDSRNGVASTVWTENIPATVTGVLATDDREALPSQLEPRDASDITQ